MCSSDLLIEIGVGDLDKQGRVISEDLSRIVRLAPDVVGHYRVSLGNHERRIGYLTAMATERCIWVLPELPDLTVANDSVPKVNWSNDTVPSCCEPWVVAEKDAVYVS